MIISQPPGASPGLERIDGGTFAGDASLELLNLTNAFREYYLLLEDVLASVTNQVLQTHLSADNGTSWVVTGYDTTRSARSGTVESYAQAIGATSWPCSNAAAMGGGNDYRVDATMRLTGMGDASVRAFLEYETYHYTATGPAVRMWIGHGRQSAKAAYNGFRVQFATANLDEGRWTLYGRLSN